MLDQNDITIEEFNGLYDRDDEEAVPPNHAIECENIVFGVQSLSTRPGISVLYTLPSGNGINRIRTFKIPGGTDRHLILDDSGNLFDSNDLSTAILTISGMTDFAVANLFDKIYISPHNGETGLDNEKVYIYDGTTLRAAAGLPPQGFDLTLAMVVPEVALTDIVAPVAPANGAQTLTTSPYVPATSTTIKFTQTGGTVTAITITVAGVDSGGDALTEIYVDKIASAGPATYTTGEIWKSITSITISALTGSGGTFKVESTGMPAGKFEIGYHVVGIVYETTSGFITKPGPVNNLAAINVTKKNRAVSVSGIPASPGTNVSKIHIVVSKFIKKKSYSGNPDPQQYEMFFVPKGSGGEIAVGTTSTIINVFDADLLDSADYLLDTLEEIPAGSCLLSTSRGRLLLGGEFDLPTTLRGSKGGEPENFSATDGFVIVKPGDAAGGVTNLAEYRDLIFVYKEGDTAAKTYVTEDTSDVLSTWDINLIDNAIGAGVNGISRVLDTEADTFDTILVADTGGLQAFSGTYLEQELSWKIKNIWNQFSDGTYEDASIVVDPKTRSIWALLNNQGSGSSQELIVNGTAETGDMTGWAIEGSVSAVSTGDIYAGTYSFLLNAADDAMDQQVAVESGAVIIVSAALYGGVETPISIQIFLEEAGLYLDSDGVTWSATPVNWQEKSVQAYELFTATPIVPAGGPYTLSVEIFVELNGRADNISILAPAEAPSSLLLYGDYSNGLNWKDIKWSKWEFSSGAIIPTCLLTDINPTLLIPRLLIGATDGNVYQFTHLGGTPLTNDNNGILLSKYETYKGSFSQDDGISHISGMRLKATGSGNLKITVKGSDGSPATTPIDLALSATGESIYVPTNLSAEDISIRLEMDALNEKFTIKRVHFFGTEEWQTKSG